MKRKQLPEIFIEQFNHKKNSFPLSDLKKADNRKVWWICEKKHEWLVAPTNRIKYGVNSITKKYSQCRKCHEMSTIKISSIVKKYFNQNLNPKIKIEELSQTSKQLINWQCINNKKHIWQAQYRSKANASRRVSKKSKYGCPFCAGIKVEKNRSLEFLYPNIFKAIKSQKDKISMGCGVSKKIEFICPVNIEHIFSAKIINQTYYNSKTTVTEAKKNDKLKCPYCLGRKLSKENSLDITHPNLAKRFDEKKNKKKIKEILYVGRKAYWWNCIKNNKHSFFSKCENVNKALKSKNKGCPICAHVLFYPSDTLFVRRKDLYNEIDKIKNKGINLKKLTYYSGESINWVCSLNKTHKWNYPINLRARQKTLVCPYCSKRKFHKTNSLIKEFPEIAKEWHYKLNEPNTPNNIKSTTQKEFYWKCLNNPTHVWLTSVNRRVYNNSSCPLCAKNFKWNIFTLKAFLNSIKDHIDNLTPAEKFLIFQQTGNPDRRSPNLNFIKNFASGKFPKEEIEKFLNNERSLVDEFIENDQLKIDKLGGEDVINNLSVNQNNTLNNTLLDITKDENNLPTVATAEVLKTLSYLVSNVHEEAIEFLIASAKHKIWNNVFKDEKKEISKLKSLKETEYAKRVQHEFLSEYNRAINLKIPKGYSFRIEGKLEKPNLMQKLTAAKVVHEKRIGNWSGTGAGKTLSAILASRVINAHNTLICCPNALANNPNQGWSNEILSVYPDSNVQLKSFEPLKTNKNNYYVFNYESFQQPDSGEKIKNFIKKANIDFIVIDEVHFSKQREVENLSIRKKNITSMIAEIQKKNKKLHVLGMSATPVINNLYEGRSLIEIITGKIHHDLPIKININNCMKLHQKLSTIGLRWMPNYEMKLTKTIIDIDCSHITQDIKDLGKHPTPLELEKILTRVKIETIKKNIEPKTLIYTHYLDDIASYIKEELEKEGWTVGMFTGEDKSGLNEFINGTTDVLIGSRTIGTGVNGLQDVCKKVIINSLPWTHAEFEQLIGRVYRQGQKHDVEIIIPLTEGTVNGKNWSWCKSRYERIKFKKTVGDAAVDGVIPSEEIRTETQVLEDLIKWINKITTLDDYEIKREEVQSQFKEESLLENTKDRLARFGDFSRINAEWNRAKSITTNKKITDNPELWFHYHQLFEEKKSTWELTPTSEIIKYFKSRDGLTIGDFGCGKALLQKELSDKHIIHSFDHYAYNKNVIACDFSKTPLDNNSLDVVVFSLSLMGNNLHEYIREAHRVLKMDGKLFIYESTSRFNDIQRFQREILRFGFDYINIKNHWKFTFIRAEKIKEQINGNPEINF